MASAYTSCDFKNYSIAIVTIVPTILFEASGKKICWELRLLVPGSTSKWSHETPKNTAMRISLKTHRCFKFKLVILFLLDSIVMQGYALVHEVLMVEGRIMRKRLQNLNRLDLIL